MCQEEQGKYNLYAYIYMYMYAFMHIPSTYREYTAYRTFLCVPLVALCLKSVQIPRPPSFLLTAPPKQHSSSVLLHHGRSDHLLHRIQGQRGTGMYCNTNPTHVVKPNCLLLYVMKLHVSCSPGKVLPSAGYVVLHTVFHYIHIIHIIA